MLIFHDILSHFPSPRFIKKALIRAKLFIHPWSVFASRGNDWEGNLDNAIRAVNRVRLLLWGVNNQSQSPLRLTLWSPASMSPLPRSWNQVFRDKHSYFGLRFKVVLGRGIKCKQKSETSANTSSKHSTGDHFHPKHFSNFCEICVFCIFYPFRQSFIRRYSGSSISEGRYITDICMQTTNRLQFMEVTSVPPVHYAAIHNN